MADASQEHRVIVIGAGIAGLVAALQLAQKNLSVTLIETATAPGGKMRQLMVDGAPIDSGPTVFTMRWVFEQIYANAGARLEDELKLTALPVLARHAWGVDQRMDLFADPARSRDAIARFAGPAEAARFVQFCKQARELYNTLEGPFIRSQSPTLASMAGDLGLRGLSVLAALGPMSSLWNTLGEHFHNPRMRQLFARYATYCGSSPWQAPATLMLKAGAAMVTRTVPKMLSTLSDPSDGSDKARVKVSSGSPTLSVLMVTVTYLMVSPTAKDKVPLLAT